MESSQPSRYHAPALEKGLDILELLARSDESLSRLEIAQSLGRTPSETYRMLTTLVQRGYVLKDIKGDGYQLSLTLFALAHSHPPLNRLISRAQPLMRSLAQEIQQSCHLCIEENGQIVVVASVQSPGYWGIALRPGSILGLYNTGSGHILAAFRSRTELDQLISSHQLVDGEMPTVREEFDDTLDRVRSAGYEQVPSRTAVGVTNIGYPVFGPNRTAVAALMCPYLERIDAHTSPGVEFVRSKMAELAGSLSLDARI
ncbi:IclR family transcriptional regulator [Brucella grignonensis]|nr:IclR family transcriptional regulator [Brucella grignonensis]NKB84724.1 IclR family transcriptional regulator [Brucella grignonensis]